MKRKQLRAGGKIDPSKNSAASLYDAGLRRFFSPDSSRSPKSGYSGRWRWSHSTPARSISRVSSTRRPTGSTSRSISWCARSASIRAIPNFFPASEAIWRARASFAEALKSYEVALKLKPDGAGIWVGIGDLQRQQKQFQEALLAYDHALSLDPRGLLMRSTKAGRC